MSCSIPWGGGRSFGHKTTQAWIEDPNHCHLPLLRTAGFHTMWALGLGLGFAPCHKIVLRNVTLYINTFMFYVRYTHNLIFIWHMISTDNFSFNTNTPVKVKTHFHTEISVHLRRYNCGRTHKWNWVLIFWMFI